MPSRLFTAFRAERAALAAALAMLLAALWMPDCILFIMFWPMCWVLDMMLSAAVTASLAALAEALVDWGALVVMPFIRPWMVFWPMRLKTRDGDWISIAPVTGAIMAFWQRFCMVQIKSLALLFAPLIKPWMDSQAMFAKVSALI